MDASRSLHAIGVATAVPWALPSLPRAFAQTPGQSRLLRCLGLRRGWGCRPHRLGRCRRSGPSFESSRLVGNCGADGVSWSADRSVPIPGTTVHLGRRRMRPSRMTPLEIAIREALGAEDVQTVRSSLMTGRLSYRMRKAPGRRSQSPACPRMMTTTLAATSYEVATADNLSESRYGHTADERSETSTQWRRLFTRLHKTLSRLT